ncbi:MULTISPECIES: DUF1415 domain-containing protein [Undibacterium]|uniref:DUF1415 domain-containing protein n=2 Tax=Undibacterium TaxID=401469 RepID=A0A941DCG8_9BURK|nr:MULTISPECIES: DUF1415 domain-containing protein [Undibacterium]MBR7745501.1 DUF1415 domain-containing protein [Undibacterium baiyunense]GGX02038.1 hypothetical protein GCM10011282_05040 [Undibacterium macrobrachii]
MEDAQIKDEVVIAQTKLWLEKAVIGLNLCPFAKGVHIKDQIRYFVSHATTPEALLKDLVAELEVLAEANPEKIDTCLLIHPFVMQDFLDYNDFLEVADATVEELDLDGILQVASFHPQYQFEDAAPDDIDNYTNRSPFPTLHLLREESIDKAVEAFPEAEQIYDKNIQTLRALGHEAWKKLFI